MRCKRNGGWTLLEMIVAIVVIGVGLAGIVAAFSTAIRGSADPLVRKQLISLAEGMIEEVAQKPWPTADSTGGITDCNRSSADDIADYANYSQGVCTPDGTAVAALSGYTVAVVVSGEATWQGVTARQITVTASRGGEQFSLTTWRTNYAGVTP